MPLWRRRGLLHGCVAAAAALAAAAAGCMLLQERAAGAAAAAHHQLGGVTRMQDDNLWGQAPRACRSLGTTVAPLPDW